MIALVGITTVKDLWDLIGDLSLTMVRNKNYTVSCCVDGYHRRRLNNIMGTYMYIMLHVY